jgi:hypothetical protein
MAAKYGLNALLFMSNRTRNTLFISVMGIECASGPCLSGCQIPLSRVCLSAGYLTLDALLSRVCLPDTWHWTRF